MSQQINFEQYLNMMRNQAWSFARSTGESYEDLLSQTYIAYDRAKRKYDGKYKFSTFLHTVVNNELNNYWKQKKAEQKEVCYGEMNEDRVRYSPSPEHAVLFKRTLQEMSREGKGICETVFESPHEFLIQDRPKLSRGRLKRHLREKGWSWPSIQRGFREIKDTLNAII